MLIKEEYRKTTVIQKSRFIACVKMAENEELARMYIESIRKEFPDSSHVCFAYITEDGQKRHSSDNREPSGTAGIPILNAIISSDVQDVCVCIVRYFGGIKLGTGGLARAYGGCAKEALEEAPKCIRKKMNIYRMHYPYELSGTIEGWLRKKCIITDLSYGEDTEVIFESDIPDLPEKIRKLSKGTVFPEKIDESFRYIDL